METGGRKKAHILLSSRSWNEELLQDVCAGLAEELHLAPNAPGGMVEFRRTLTLSFFFKFYLTVLQKLGRVNPENVSIGQSLFSTVWGLSRLGWMAKLLLPFHHLRAEEQGQDNLGTVTPPQACLWACRYTF